MSRPVYNPAMISAAMVRPAAPLTSAEDEPAYHMIYLLPLPAACQGPWRRSDRIRHRGAALAERLFGAHRGVPRGLVLDFGIQFGSEQNDDRRHPHPHHGSDRRAERAVGGVVIGEIGEI